MTIVNGYTDLASLRQQLGFSTSDSTADDARLEQCIEAVSRQIDAWTGRQFYPSTGTRYYQTDCGDEVLVDDLLSVSSLTTDQSYDRTYNTTWSTSDYELEPANAPSKSQPEPYWKICTTPSGSYVFPNGRRAVKINGTWGYSTATPEVVQQACLIQAHRVSRRKDSPFGIAGSLAEGTIKLVSALDPDVKMLLWHLRNPTAV